MALLRSGPGILMCGGLRRRARKCIARERPHEPEERGLARRVFPAIRICLGNIYRTINPVVATASIYSLRLIQEAKASKRILAERYQMDEPRIQNTGGEPRRRVDIYLGIHKGLRALMANTLLALGRVDCSDDWKFEQALDQVSRLLQMCASHLAAENKWVHPAIESKLPGATQVAANGHVEHDLQISQLYLTLETLRGSVPALREDGTHQLYKQLALFVAENFQHMNVEETHHNAILWSHYTDSEIARLQEQLVADAPPEEKMFMARWLVPFVNPMERMALVSKMRASAPPAAFHAMLEIVRPGLSDDEWAKLHWALGPLATSAPDSEIPN